MIKLLNKILRKSPKPVVALAFHIAVGIANIQLAVLRARNRQLRRKQQSLLRALGQD